VGATLFFLTATWLAGQGVDPQRTADAQPGSAADQSPSFRERIRSWNPFARRTRHDATADDRSSRPAPQVVVSPPTPAAGTNKPQLTTAPAVTPRPGIKLTEPPLLDARQAQAPAKMHVTASIGFHAAAGSRKGLSPKMAGKVGHETDYSWITGQIRRETDGWIIHYATRETVDRYGGQLLLVPSANMNAIRDGDLVCVQGQPEGSGSAATYHARAVNLIEHEGN
jgi:hypothetical protein